MFNAQVKQDVFVNKILQKNEGFFLDIGAGTGGLTGRPVEFYSNTYFFVANYFVCFSWGIETSF